MTDVVRAYRQHYEAQSMSIDNSIARGSTQQASVAHVMLSQYWLELPTATASRPTDNESAVGLGWTGAKLSIAGQHI